MLGVQIILMSNAEDQLLAVQDSGMDVPLSIDVSQGVMLKSLCGGKRLRLTEGGGQTVSVLISTRRAQQWDGGMSSRWQICWPRRDRHLGIKSLRMLPS